MSKGLVDQRQLLAARQKAHVLQARRAQRDADGTEPVDPSPGDDENGQRSALACIQGDTVSRATQARGLSQKAAARGKENTGMDTTQATSCRAA